MTEVEILIQAHRYLYYVECDPVIGDYEYDKFENQVKRHIHADSPVHKPGSDSASDYPPEVKTKAKQLRQCTPSTISAEIATAIASCSKN